MKKRYETTKLKRSNIFIKACNLSERVCNFDTKNIFIFYGVMMEKLGVNRLFTTF